MTSNRSVTFTEALFASKKRPFKSVSENSQEIKIIGDKKEESLKKKKSVHEIISPYDDPEYSTESLQSQISEEDLVYEPKADVKENIPPKTDVKKNIAPIVISVSLTKEEIIKKMKSIESEFEERRKELEHWRSIFERNLQLETDHSYEVRTFFPSQFEETNGRSACSYISLLVIYNWLRKELGKYRTILDLDWPVIIEMGSGAWAVWKQIQNEKIVEAMRHGKPSSRNEIVSPTATSFNVVPAASGPEL